MRLRIGFGMAALGRSRWRAHSVHAACVGWTFALLNLAFISAAWADFVVTNNSDSGPGSLRQAILDANALNAPTGVPIYGVASTITINPGIGAITLTSGPLPLIYSNLNIVGAAGGSVLDGSGTFRGLFVSGLATTGNGAPAVVIVNISNLAIQNVVAQGGAGGANVQSGGGGLGAGGGLFINQNANVTITNTTFANAAARGGAGGSVDLSVLSAQGGGGGGLGGAGGGSGSAGGGGGGGGLFFAGSSSGTANGAGGGGGGGITGAGQSGRSNGVGGNGGAGAAGIGGGGGGGTDGTAAAATGGGVGAGAGGLGTSSAGGAGGAGGFGGGGGGGWGSAASGGFGGGGGGAGQAGNVNSGGNGGFGGGGGAGSAGGNGGNGGFGGGGAAGNGDGIGGVAGAGGFGAGGGETGTGGGSTGAAGGGGAGLGGAVFVAAGGTLTVAGTWSINGSSVQGGTAGGAAAGSGSQFGAGIFYQGAQGTTSTLAFGTGYQVVSDTIADYVGSGGTNPSGGANAADQGGSVAIAKTGSGTLTLSAANTYTGGTTVTAGLINFNAANNFGSGAITLNGGGLQWATGNTADISGRLAAFGSSGATFDTNGNNVTLASALTGTGGLTKAGQGVLLLTTVNAYGGGTTVAGGTLQLSGAGTLGAASSVTTLSGGTLDLGGTTQTQSAVNLGGGTVQNGGLNAAITSSGGTIDSLSGTASLTTTSGTTTVVGTNTYTGGTVVNGGTLDVEGSISDPTVNSGGTLTGSGSVGDTFVNSGGTFAPGSGTPGTSMAIVGNLAFQSGAIYMIYLNPTTSSFATVTGTATLGGATVNAVFANGSYISKTYTILTATGGVSGTFAPTVANTNLPANFHTSLSYDANDAYLDLSLNYAALNFGSGLNGNQQAVANALVNSFNANGGIPLVYGALNGAGLTQASGELGTSSQQTTFNAMGQFMGLLTDPFMQRNGGAGMAPGAPGFAEDDAANAYAARKRSDAFAMFTKAPPAPFAQRWSVWAAGFGGSQSTDGNVVTGSNNTTSNVYGTAVGADYLFSPNTLAGFALAGGGTSFSVNGLGSGRSDLFQAGAYVRHTNGPAYISAALSYGWQDITTDRIVTAAGIDHLRAEFNANAWSGRMEGGYRFVAPWGGGIGLTPYVAAQFTTFDLPAYAEQVISGASTFALSYGAHSPTDTRSDLGLRTDKSFALQDAVLTLRGRLAWAHDFDPDRSIAATFQALPGASFVVNGAAQAANSALTTASAELKWMNGWSAATTFEGEFSGVTRSYAAKGVVRYAW